VPANFLYSDAGAYYFMDETTYEQFAMLLEKMAEVKGYLKENSPVEIVKFNGAPVSLELPQYVELCASTPRRGKPQAAPSPH